MQILGYFLALLIGISLGLIGGGGSVLTVPILVYLIGIPASTATGYSLFVVGTSALFGGFQKLREGGFNIRNIWIFGIPDMLTVLFMRAYVVPNIPDQIATIGDFVLTKDLLTMLVFALMMLLASLAMLLNTTKNISDTPKKAISSIFMMLIGMSVGAFTGFVGAGGGFMIIPALVMLGGVNMKEAIGTSLLIIAMKSLVGFIGELYNISVDWPFLLIFTGIAVVGIFVGNMLSRKIDGSKLKSAFGWFVLIMAIIIIVKETLL